MQIQKIRDDFPILKESMNGKPLIYLDNGATSLKPLQVLEAEAVYNTKKTANVHRGVYKLSNEATELYEEARATVAKFINADYKEIVFTKGATEALNMIAMGYGLSNLKKGDEIITSELEHHSSFLPWQNVAKLTGAKLVKIPLNDEGRITIENFKKALTDKTKVVAINYVSNVMGYMAPVKEICEICSERNIITNIDAAQAAPHLKIDVRELNCDFLSFTGHKMLAPTGVGVLYGKFKNLQQMNPVNFGGEMIDLVEFENSTYKDAPFKFEAGTPVIAGAIGLKAAVDYLENIGMEKIHAHEMELRKYAISELLKIEGIKIFNENAETGIISFNVANIHPHDMATVYDSEGVCVRAGHHCAQLLMKWLKQPATLRASIYLYNTKEEIDTFIKATITGKETFEDGIFF
ncbi:MAG: SufS family cysteine desulfurase [Defluviitaleaceae bacterium]|nr:SufS family cysteine desulfurase [Defluviitaleaceae bacterium]